MGYCSLLLPCLVSSGGGVVFGYELAIISGALLQLRVDFSLSCVQQEALVSALLVGGLLASVVGGSLIDWQGRRKSILFSTGLTLAGTVLLLINAFPALVLGRAIVGFAMCISSMSCCIFVSELVRPEHRGVLVSLYEVGITVGILVAYAVNYMMADTRDGWKWMFGLAAVPTVVQLVSLLCLPTNTQSNCAQIMNQESARRYNYLSLFHTKDNMRTRTMIGLALVLFQQFTGQPNVLLYASTIFYTLGFHSHTAAVLASLGLGLVKVLSTLFSMTLSDRVGRRPLLIGGCSVMAVSLIIVGLFSTHFHVQEMACVSKGVMSLTNITETHEPHIPVEYFNETTINSGTRPDVKPSVSSPLNTTAANWVVLLSLMAVVSSYSIGFGPMTWLLLSEIFPTEVRGRAFAFTNCFNWSAHVLVTFTFLHLIDAIGLPRLFLLYGTIAVVAAAILCKILPETKGKSLEDIDKELRLNRFYQNEDCCGVLCRRNSPPQYHKVDSQDMDMGKG
ncbi:solute carrier family 2, facilitated glucose transporter member 10 [Boleophthalmus pectinirostris]|uniref:solute carrier family 2, facilitated glucose transporter member 10 n=1 Tax=Boleophthalmus pectinirostris TaxID=150288 RepID=UPI00242BD085|nr:solute carrier family 2, facilitated glucose transporter member 10 [Boleophthalmus pectinirostris]